MGTTPKLGLPYPEPTDRPAGDEQIKALAEKLDTTLTDGTTAPTLEQVTAKGATSTHPVTLTHPADKVGLTLQPAADPTVNTLEVKNAAGDVTVELDAFGTFIAGKGRYRGDIQVGGSETPAADKGPRIQVRDMDTSQDIYGGPDGLSLLSDNGRLRAYKVTGSSGQPITDYIKLAPSADANNQLTLGTDKGLFVPPGGAPPVVTTVYCSASGVQPTVGTAWTNVPLAIDNQSGGFAAASDRITVPEDGVYALYGWLRAGTDGWTNLYGSLSGITGVYGAVSTMPNVAMAISLFGCAALAAGAAVGISAQYGASGTSTSAKVEAAGFTVIKLGPSTTTFAEEA